ncbi:MAG: hypothetical protein MJ188_05590 [Treponema sp.]|nr:hypothetical protein [Treponema sp.]
MNKVVSNLSKILKVILLSISVALFFNSCDNFLNGGELKSSLESRIDYANADSASIIIKAEEGSGSTIPAGNYSAKVGYSFEVSFSENKDYSFIEWQAVSQKDNSKILGKDIVKFENPTELKTNVTVYKKTGDIQIVPKCVERIAISSEPTPRYEANGVSRDRSIVVTFSKNPAQESFIFNEDELPSGATPKTDEAGNIWAYGYNNQTFLKNISITDTNDISIVEYFLQPKIEGKILTIEVDKLNPIPLESTTEKKSVNVKLSNKICDENGVRMSEERHWTYMINATTDEQAEIIISCIDGQGTLGNFGEKIIQKEYSIGYSLDLDFKESADYQFIKWDFDSTFITVADAKSANTKATILTPTEKNSPTQIKAVCEPRLKITAFAPENDAENLTVSKNSSIILTFNKNLPTDAEGMSQLENITISVGGSPAKSSFLMPVVNENTVTFTADKTNMLYVPAGQTKTVTVTIPSDLYYQLEDGTKVYLGGNGKTFDYKIDSSTLDKTEITFTASPNSGTVNPGAGTYKYSLEEEVNLSFKVNDGFTFNYWLVKDAEGNIVDDSEIKIDDRTSPNTKLTIYDILSGVNITAQCSEDFRVVEATPGRDKTNTKDSDIKITFNKDLDSGCNALLNKIKISIDGSIIDSYFETRTISGKTITIKNTKYLSVDKDSEKQITVTVPKDFFYIDGTEKVLLKEDYSFTYNIDYQTKEKSNIWIQIINGETGKIFENGITAATINTNGLEQLNIGETISVNLDVKKGYQFVGWQLVNENGNPVTNDFVKMSSSSMQNIELTAVKPLKEAYLKALCYKRPAVLSGACSPRPTDLRIESAKNAPIIVTFDKPIDSGCENAIELTYSGINFSKANNYKTSIDSDRKVVTLTNSKMPILSNAYETIYVHIPHEKIYYLTANNIKITMEEDEDWSFRINNRTLTNTTIRFDAARINVDGTTLSSPKETYNIEQVIPLQYNLSDDYTFNGWKIESATTGYIVEPSDFTKTGTIYIKSADDTNKNYLKMEIDSDNPLKGTITVLDSIGNGVNEYGVTVSISESKRPAVSSVSVSGTTTTVSRDTPVVITFDKNIIPFTENLASTVRDYVTITSNGENITELYSANYNSGTNSLILTPASPTAIPVSGNYRDITVSLNASGVYYFDNVDTDSDGEVDHQFKTYLKDDYRFVYRVNPETSVKTEVQYLIDENSASNTDSIKIDSTFRTKEYKESYSVGKVTSLQYSPSSGYVFTGWKLLTDLEGYTVSPAGYVTSGTISVIKDSETYYTLEIDEENPTKAIGTVLKAMTENADGQTEQPSLKVFVRDAIIPTVKSNSTNGTTTIVPRDTEVSFTFNVEVEDFAKSGANSAIKVTSSGEDLTDLFNIVYNAERKTVTLTPKNPDAIPLTTKYRDVTVTVNKSLIVYKPYERADISINMKEDASFTYRVNSITTAKTSVQYVVGKCESSSSVSSIKIAGSSKESGELQEYSIGETVSLQYTAPVDYRFFGWKIESVNGYTVSPEGYVKEGTINVTKGDETYAVLSISDLDASKANLTIIKEMKIEDGSALTVSVMDGAIPKVVSNIPSNALLAVPRDSIVSFTFNVDIGEFSSDAIQVISGEENLLDRYSVRYSAETKTVTLVPLSPTAIPITSGTKSLRVSVIAENIIYSPLSGIFIGMEKDYSFTYKINTETSSKTRVEYAYGNDGNESSRKIKIDGVSRNLNEYKEECNVGQISALQYTVTPGYGFTGWKVEAISGYTVNPSGYVNSGTITVSRHGTNYYTLAIDEENPLKAVGTVLKAIEASTTGNSSAEIKVNVREAIIPAVVSQSVSGTAIVNPRDTIVSFIFNVEVEDFVRNGTNTAVRVSSNGEDLTELFNIRYEASRKTVTLTPKEADAIPVATKYRDITVTINGRSIIYKPYAGTDIQINMSEDYSFVYRINAETDAKTVVKYVVEKGRNSSTANVIKVDGVSHESESRKEYSVGENTGLQYSVPSGYKFLGWQLEAADDYTVSPSGYRREGEIRVTKGEETYAVLTINEIDSTKATISILKGIGTEDESSVIVKAIDSLIPMVVSKNPDSSSVEYPRDSIVSVSFNVDIGGYTENSIKIVSNGEDLLDKYTVTYLSDAKTLTLVPISPTAIPITSGTRTITVNVISDFIKNVTDFGMQVGMEKDYSFTYKINTETSSKTRVEYAYGNDGNESSRKIKIDGVSRNLNEYKEECNVGQISALQYTVTPGYGFTGWKVEAISGYTVNPSGYVNSGTITVSRHGTNYYTLAIDEENPLKAVGTVLKAIDSEEETAALTLSVSEVLIPVLSAPIAPVYNSSGVPCDSNIVIPFNIAMDKSTITCSETGTIQIVNSLNKNEHYESYYSSSWVGNTLTLIPSTSIYGLLKEDEVLTLQVIFATNRIKAANGQDLTLDSNDYLYRINSKREEEKPIVEKLDLYKAPYEYGEILNVGLANYILLSDKDISNFASADYTRNHINNEIRLDATVYDEESGFLKLTISETNISDSNKEYPPIEVLFPSYTASTGKYQYRYKYYQLRSEKNGLIKLTFNFEDVAGNITKITRYVISDTILDEANIVVAQPSASPFKKTVKNTAINREIYSIPADGFVRETENGIDTVTFTFTNQKEVFYKNGSNSYSDYYSYQLDFGYEPNMYMAGSYRSKDNTFTIERDETKITYLKFTAYDSVGNSNSITRVLLPKTEISSIIKGPNAYGPYIIYKDQRYYESQLAAYGADEVWTYIMYKPVKFNETSAANTAYMQDGQNNYLISSYTSRYSTYFVPPIYIINDTTTSYDSTHQANVRMPAGEYDIYVMPGLRYRGSEIIYGPVSEPHRIKVEYNESTKLNYIPDSQYAAKPEITGVSNLVPSSAPVCTKTSAGLNSGMFVLNVSYPSGFTPLSGYTYYARVASYFNASKYGTLYYPMDDSSISINVSGDDAYYVSIEARDTQGRAKESSRVYVNCRTDDNIAPTLNAYSSSVASIDDVSDAPGQSTLYYKYGYTDSWPKDNTGGSGIKVDANNNFTVEYWNIKNPLNTPDPVTYTNAQLTSKAFANYKNTGIFKYVSNPSGQINSDAFVRLKYEDLDEGYYTLSIKIKDNNENYVLVNWPMYNIVLNWDFNLQCINNGTSVSPDWYIKADFGTKNPEGRAPSPTKIAFDIIDGNTETRIYDNITSEDRVKYPDPYFYSNKKLSSSPILDLKASNIYTIAPITSELVKNKFVKVIAKETGKGFYNYQYIYPDYYLYKGTSSAITCSTKNIIAGFGDNYQIYTDNPTYVHTMYWKENLGNKLSYWETRGIERGEKLDTAKSKRDFTYSVTDEMVPAGKGYWYVVVAHFADGSVIMTDPKQKN